MRPAGSTAVCSTMTSPAPDSDSEPKCCRCQSLAAPFSALYWHIGDTAIRLARVMPPRLTGSNREGDLSIRWTQTTGSIADDRAALVAHPICEAQIIDPDIVKSGAHR